MNKSMKPACTDAPALRDRIATTPPGAAAFFDRAATARYGDLVGGTSLGGRRGELAGRSVLLATASQLTAALALIELDGCARRIVILPPDVAPEYLAPLIAAAEIDAVVTDADTPRHAALELAVACRLRADDRAGPGRPVAAAAHRVGDAHLRHHRRAENGDARFRRSDWRHRRGRAPPTAPRCGARSTTSAAMAACRFFCAPFSAAPRLFLSSAGEPVAEHLARLARHGVTHLSGTPSHWRRALMNPAIGTIAPRYVRLSGEIADQAVLDGLRAAFPDAAIGHAYASTEAGVAFEVNDGLAGFPADYIGGGAQRRRR